MDDWSALATRDPAPLLEAVRRDWGGQRDLWVFGYASLIWNPCFPAAEQRPALVHGWHRALRMRSRINRGTPQQPGLVFALISGGSCRGVAYRIERDHVAHELPRLWEREMPTATYDPRWLPCRTPHGPVRALGFTLSRASPSLLDPLPDEQLRHILRHAHGRYGSTLAYVLETAASLRRCGIRDREIERLERLARTL